MEDNTFYNGTPTPPRKSRRLLMFILGFLMGVIIMTAISAVIIRQMRRQLSGQVAAIQAAQEGPDGSIQGAEDSEDAENAEAADRETGQNAADGAQITAVDADAVKKLQLLEEYMNTYYYEMDSVNRDQLQDGMFKGLVGALNDPYSTYYNAEELKDITSQTEGLYGGVGATLQKNDNGFAEIVGLFRDAPAEKAGVRVGDVIYMVDETVCTSDMELSDVTKMIRGEPGTTVKLTVIRGSETIELEITRALVEYPTVSSEMKENNIGYLSIAEFDDVTVDQFHKQFEDLKSQGMKALILDLRGNPGGNVSTVTAVASELLPKGLIFYMEDKNGQRKEYTCDGADFNLPLIVLVDGSSASASEILAGAIQDAGIGRLVGTKTFGKGIVQTIYPLRDGSAIKLTIAGYYTRGGRDIHKQGIDPDVEIEFDADRYYDGDGADNQLEKAIELLKEEMGK